MNKQRILELAQYIESLPHIALGDFDRDTVAFNMGVFFRCSAPCCIAGWACKLFVPGYVHSTGVPLPEEVAGTVLGLDTAENGASLANSLFDPQLHYKRYSGMLNKNITPKQAAQTLRYLAETGDVVWFDEEGDEI